MQEPISQLPANIEAEQAVLGALLLQNDLYDRVSGKIAAAAFHDPVHGDIFAAIAARIERGSLASPVTLLDDMAAHRGLAELGAGYLARLAGASISGHAVGAYADTVAELHKRRSLVAIADDLRGAAMGAAPSANEALTEAEGRLYALAEGEAEERGPVSFASSIFAAVSGAMEVHQRGGGMSGLPTGLIDLDQKLGGLGKSDLVILAGRPGIGKTALAVNIAFSMAKRGLKLGIFSLEMSHDQLTARILSDATELSSYTVKNGQMTEDEARRYVEAGRELAGLHITIDDTPALSIAKLAQRARRMKRTTGLDFLVVDYLQLLKCSNPRAAGNRVQELSEITMGLKALAKELQIPVLALSQLSRAVEAREDKRPQLSDLRESGSIEQDADVVMFVYRHEYYLEREKPAVETGAEFAAWLDAYDRARGLADVIVGKNRHGPVGTVELTFEARLTRFGNLAR